MEAIKLNLIYIYDAYCTWCYALGGVMAEVEKAYADLLDVEVLSGGMVLPETPQHISVLAEAYKSGVAAVKERVEADFGPDFLWHIHSSEESDWLPNSLKPAIALSIIKKHKPTSSLVFANDLQTSLFAEGRDLTDDEAYRHLLEKYDLDADDFYKQLHSEEMADAARYDFALAKQLQVTSFPTVLLQESESKFHLMAKGYTDFETLSKRLNSGIASIHG